MANQKNLQELLNSPKAKIALVIMLICVVVFVGYRISRPLWEQYRGLSKDIKRLSKKTEEEDISIPLTRKAMKEEIKHLEAKITAQEKMFFSTTEDILAILDRFAQESKISIKTITPQNIVKKDIPHRSNLYFLILPIKIKLKCDYFQLIDFLKKIEGLEKTIIVNTIDIHGDNKDIWAHTIGISINVPLLIAAR